MVLSDNEKEAKGECEVPTQGSIHRSNQWVYATTRETEWEEGIWTGVEYIHYKRQERQQVSEDEQEIRQQGIQQTEREHKSREILIKPIGNENTAMRIQ